MSKPPEPATPPATNGRDAVPLTKAQRIQLLLLILGVVLVGVGLLLVFLRFGAGPSTVTTKGTTTNMTVTTTPGPTALGSDTIDSFFLGSGLILILVSAFYDRITSIGFPGGGTIALSPVAQAKVAAAVGKNLQNSKQIAAAYKHAVATLSTEFWGYPATPSDEAIEAAATSAYDAVVPHRPDPAPPERE
jgi:hypothetical protein